MGRDYLKLHILICFIGALMLLSGKVWAEPKSKGTALTVEVTGKLALCNHSERGEIILNVSGGVAPYSYQWSTGADTEIISNLNTGTYTVRISDKTGEWITRTIIIQPPFVLTTELINQKDASCDGKADGEIELRIIRGRGPYKIAWSHGLENETRATGLVAGSYSVNITDFYQCTNTIAFVISSGSGIEILPEIRNLSCGKPGAVSIEVKGGVAPFRYEWLHGADTKDLKDLDAGIYEIKVTDAKGCSVDKRIEVTNTDAPLLEWVEKLDVNCAGSASGVAVLQVKGGQAPFKIEWMDDRSVSGLTRRDLKAGSYELKVEDKNGCVVTSSFEIKEPAPLSVKLNTRLDVNCSNSGAEGHAWIQITGGEGPYDIRWSNGAVGLKEISFGKTGRISVEVSDAKGCKIAESQEINLPNFSARLHPSEKMIIVEGKEEYEVEEPILFNGKVPEDAIAWEWNFGDGNTSDQLRTSHIYKTEGVFEVTLTVHNLYGCATIESYRVEVEDRSALMMVPTAFSPNGDGLNDTFIPKWKNIAAFEMQIYNTWGELLFSTAEMESNGWNGYLQGRLVPRGSYVYKITYTTLKGVKLQKSGVFTLVK